MTASGRRDDSSAASSAPSAAETDDGATVEELSAEERDEMMKYMDAFARIMSATGTHVNGVPRLYLTLVLCWSGP